MCYVGVSGAVVDFFNHDTECLTKSEDGGRRQDGRPSAAAAADVRAPLEAVELQTGGVFGGTPADVSGGGG